VAAARAPLVCPLPFAVNMRQSMERLSLSHPPGRTLVLGKPRASFGFRERVTRLATNLPMFARSAVRRLVQPQTLAILGAFTAVLFAIGVVFYNQFAREIDLRLQSGQIDNAFELVSAPLKLSVGDSFPDNDLSGYLTAAGYQKRSLETQENNAGQFEINGNTVDISSGGVTREGDTPVRIQLDKSGHVVRLTEPATGKQLPSVLIEGQLLAAVHEGDRRKRIDVQFSDVPQDLRNAIV